MVLVDHVMANHRSVEGSDPQQAHTYMGSFLGLWAMMKWSLALAHWATSTCTALAFIHICSDTCVPIVRKTDTCGEGDLGVLSEGVGKERGHG